MSDRDGTGPQRPDGADRTDGTTDEAPDTPMLRRRRAEGAAGDLARMGIDPRSLGLGDLDAAGAGGAAAGSRDIGARGPGAGSSGPGAGADAAAGGEVLPLRPEFRTHPEVAPDAAPPAAAPHPVSPDVDPPAAFAPAPGPPVQGRPDSRRLFRSVVSGLVTPDGAVAMQDERSLVDAVRSRQGDRRIVAFVAGKGGVGATTVAVATGTTLVALREDRSCVVDVQQGTPSLGLLLRVEQPTTVSELLARHEVVEPPTAVSGLGVVDGADWDLGLTRADIGGVLERLGAETTFHLLDVGDEPGEGGHTALARADQVVAVTGPGEVGVAALRSVVERVRRVNPMAASRLATVIVCPDEDSHRRTRQELGAAAGSVVVVPPDAALRAGEPYDPARVSAATREAMLRVAALVAAPADRAARSVHR